MSLAAEARVGKKYALYIPKNIVQAVGIKEGDKLLLKVEGKSLTVEILKSPVELAISTKKFASISFRQIEEISREEQAKRIEGSG